MKHLTPTERQELHRLRQKLQMGAITWESYHRSLARFYVDKNSYLVKH